MLEKTMNIFDSLIFSKLIQSKKPSYCFNNYECLTYTINEYDSKIKKLHICNELGNVKLVAADEGKRVLTISAGINIKGNCNYAVKEYIKDAIDITMGDTITVRVNPSYKLTRKLSEPKVDFYLSVPKGIEVVFTNALGTVILCAK